MSASVWLILRGDETVVCDALSGYPLTWSSRDRAVEWLHAAPAAIQQGAAYVTPTERCKWRPPRAAAPVEGQHDDK